MTIALHSARKSLLLPALGVALLLAPPLGPAQQSVPPTPVPTEPPHPTPTLDDILLSLEKKLVTYEATVPSFFCDEHVAAEIRRITGFPFHRTTVTESIFRLKRSLSRDRKSLLTESREIRTVDGLAAKGQELDGPVILSGAFSGSLALVSLSQKDCMRYNLHPIEAGHETDPYIVEFASVSSRHRRPDCMLREDATGRVFIDPATMQITRAELLAPHHIIVPAFPGPQGQVRVDGVWKVQVQYASVLLGGKPFWMPSTITSTATNSGPNQTVWSFTADYSNYHKLEVNSHILPFAPQP